MNGALRLVCVCLPLLVLVASGNEDYGEFRSQELTCRIGNNVEVEEHRAGYNGVFSLSSIHQRESVFVPAYAGLNLEHIFDGSARGSDHETFFEPRFAPMSFVRIDKRTARLHQKTTPVWQVESTTTFHLRDPYYIDVVFECVPHRDHFEGGAMGLFWASYINGPLDKAIYFLATSGQEPFWQQFSTQFHTHDSTVKHRDDGFAWTLHAGAPRRLFTQISEVRYKAPFFYGRFRNMVFVIVFDRTEGIRFTHSPSGGGRNPWIKDTNPAWDFQWVIPKYEVGQTHRMKYTVVYKLWEGRQDVLRQVERCQRRLSANP